MIKTTGWFDMTSKQVLQWDFAVTTIEIDPLTFSSWTTWPESLPVGTHVRVIPANRRERRSLLSTFGVIAEVLPSGSYRVKHKVRPRRTPPPRQKQKGWKEAEKSPNERVWRHSELETLSDLEILGAAFSY